MNPGPNLAPHMEAVARTLRGDPNLRMSNKTELRFGSNGSLSIDLVKGTFFDHEAEKGGGVLDLIARETGLKNREAIEWMRDKGMPVEAIEKPAPAQRRVVATYDYVDEFGELLMQVVRFDPKDFRQRRPDPLAQDGWSWSVKGVELVPYRLPELLEDIAHERTIFIVEGEKAVDFIRAKGIPATCNPMGANKWPASLSAFFRDADVVIARDNNEPGRAHGKLVADSLAEVARSIRLLDPPGIPEKAGLDDWFVAHAREPDDLYRLADAAALRPGDVPVESRFGALWLHEIIDGDHRVDWIAKQTIPANSFGAFVGEPGCGKSFLALDLCFSAAVLAKVEDPDARWFGRRVQHGGAIYIAAEGQNGFRKRTKALWSRYKVPRDVYPFVLLPTAVDLRSEDGDTDGLITEIQAHAARMRAPLALIVVDTLNRVLVGGDENDSKDMGAFIRHAEKIQKATKATVIAVHHKNASGTRERGHSSLRGALDFLVGVEKSESGGNTWKVEKQKDEEDGVTFNFNLKSEIVGVDEDGDSITSCVVEPLETRAGSDRAKRDRRKLPPQAVVALRLLVDVCNEIGKPVPLSGMRAKGVRLVDWRDFCARNHLVAPGSGDDTFRKAFQRALDILREQRRIGVHDDWVWAVLQKWDNG